MVIDMNRSFPVRVHPWHLESPESYGLRLAVGNGLAKNAAGLAASQLLRDEGLSSLKVALARWCEVKGQLTSGHFERQSTLAGVETMRSRYLCRLCARGDEIKLIDHAVSNCCLRHGLWTGPAIMPDDQKPVGQKVLSAERTYRRLRRKGQASLALFKELSDLVARDYGMDSTHHLFRPETYPVVVNLAQALTNPGFLLELLDPTKTFREARVWLQKLLESLSHGVSSTLAEAVWLLLRPAFLRVREYLEGRIGGQDGVIAVDADEIYGGYSVQRPLEPFSRYLFGTTAATDMSVAARFELHLVPGQFELPRRQVRRRHQIVEFYCSNGHRYTRTTNAADITFRSGQSGCPYCSGRSALAGFNSMSETYPWLVAAWDHHRNEGTTPSDITGAGNSKKYWWKCGFGHSWESSPNNRARGRGCPYCSGRFAIPGLNTLDVSHPAIGIEWDYMGNDALGPWLVLGGSGKKVGWICPVGHRYKASPGSRTGRGTGCPVCANLQVLQGFNDMATTHPEIVLDWDSEANGTVRATDVVAGSRTMRKWRCQLGHSYEASPISRINGRGCPICSGQKVSPTENSLAAVRPELAAYWHPTANGRLTPDQFNVSSGRKIQWECTLGHKFVRSIASFAANSGCPVCSGHQVLSGFNDLKTRHPEIAAEWNLMKNGSLTAQEVLPGNKHRWWLCPNGHELRSTVPNRLKTNGCSRCPPEHRALLRSRLT